LYGLSARVKSTRRPDGWIGRIEIGEGPIFIAVADAIGAAIVAGELRPGQQLPTHRSLADSLGVDLTTITRAYSEARRRGLLQATVGRGTFVRSQGALTPPQTMTPRGPVDLGMNVPPLPPGTQLEHLLQDGLSRLMATSEAAQLLTYQSACGTLEQRAAGTLWLRPTLGKLDVERVLICSGAQSALTALLGTLAQPNNLVLTDTLTYPGLRAAAAHLGIQLVGVATDADGILPDALEKACRKVRPQALYCVPTIQNPTTATMPLQRRRAIAETARRNDLRVIEDDAYGLLPSSPLPAIASLAPEISFHVSTVSKALSPALRIAYLAVPDAPWAMRMRSALQATALMASPLLTSLVTAWVNDGTANTILSAIRRESAARQAIAREVLPKGSFAAHPEGLHLWVTLPSRWDRRDFVANLQQQSGLVVVATDAFAVVTSRLPEAVRVSLGAASTRDRLQGALESVAAALRREAVPPFAGVV
jgi:DNA-binding transcriptional MocR family regulator